MADLAESLGTRLAGRAEELRLLRDALGRAAAGHPSASFVHGEAGIGKTYLARAVAADAQARGHAVLWGQCVRFGAGESPMLAWVLAFERWLADADEADRTAVLTGPGPSLLLPSLGGATDQDPVRLVQAASTLLARISARRPVLLVLDDVQWADTASRDTLTYLVAGFARERITVVATYRDEGIGPGDPLHGWLGDLRRLPGVSDVRLEPLQRDEIEVQLGRLLGGPADPRLAEAVARLSDGNPYLAELLVHGLTPEDQELPGDLPVALGEALLASWHRLDETPREVVRVLAVAGRPARVDALVDVGGVVGLTDADVLAGLQDATRGGIVVSVDPRQVWLRHPLLADVLYETYPPGQAAGVHRAWADALASAVATGVDEVRRLGDLAQHLHAAGDDSASFRAWLAGAEEAGRQRLWRQEALHLRRATELCDALPGPQPGLDVGALFERAGMASHRVGDDLEALAAGERALALARAHDDPLVVGRLAAWCAHQRWWLGHVQEQPLADFREAVRLTSSRPDSPEHAGALAALSEGLGWTGEYDQALRVAEEAVAAGLRSGSTLALSQAYGARAFASYEDLAANRGRVEQDTRESLRLALECEDPDQVQWASVGRINLLESGGRRVEATRLAEESEVAALETGAIAAAGWHCARVAYGLADEGRLRDGAEHVRIGVSLVGPGNGNAAVRLSALVIAVRRGDLAAADQHARRAREQIPVLEERPGLEAPPILAEHLCADGRPDEAVALLRRTMPAQAVDPRVLDLMLLWGARAAADLAEVARARGGLEAQADARRRLVELVAQREDLPGEVFAVAGPDDVVQPAVLAVFEAERARCEGTAASVEPWLRASGLCAQAGMGWERHLAEWRAAEALLAGGDRSGAGRHLREVYDFARAEGAVPLRDRVVELARISRVALDVPVLPDQRAGDTSPLASLTAREREVLTHLVAGHTYSEIAGLLFISEKTVSTHVSHVLAKTGTSSRREAAALALRLSRAGD